MKVSFHKSNRKLSSCCCCFPLVFHIHQVHGNKQPKTKQSFRVPSIYEYRQLDTCVAIIRQHWSWSGWKCWHRDEAAEHLNPVQVLLPRAKVSPERLWRNRQAIWLGEDLGGFGEWGVDHQQLEYPCLKAELLSPLQSLLLWPVSPQTPWRAVPARHAPCPQRSRLDGLRVLFICSIVSHFDYRCGRKLM